MKVKIIGAGSIGIHLAQASRRMGWDVTVTDIDPKALQRMREDIYPKRYGAWDESIKLYLSKAAPKGGFDGIFIGTPPDVRMALALEALGEEPKILQLEKPFCTPFLEGMDEFLSAYRAQNKTIAVVGYDHAVSESIEEVIRLLNEKTIGEVQTLDVEFREHWQGIFNAHPWLAGPQDSYLGFWKRGGGAGNEHSHALHLWQLLARHAGLGIWEKTSVAMQIKEENYVAYDSLVAFTFITNTGKIGRVVQDVITLPVRKWIRAQGSDGFIEWVCNGHPEGDLVRYARKGNPEVVEKVFKKKRPDDFYRETLHMRDILEGKIRPADSPISLESGVAVMEVLSIAYQNPQETSEIKRMR